MFAEEEGALWDIRQLLAFLCVSREENLLVSSPQK